VNECVWSVGGLVLTGKTEVLGDKYYAAWLAGDECVWSVGGMVLTGVNRSIRRECLYSLCGS